MTRSFESYTLLLLIGVFILANAIHFPFEMERITTDNYKAVHSFETSDILWEGRGQIYNTHNLFLNYRRYMGSQTTLLVPPESDFKRPASNFRERMAGIARLRNINSTETQTPDKLTSIRDNHEPVASDTIWEWPGHEDTREGVTWELYTKRPGNVDKVILFEPKDGHLMVFVDEYLLTDPNTRLNTTL